MADATAATSSSNRRAFKPKPDPKLPDYRIPVPSLLDFYGESYIQREEESYTYTDETTDALVTISGDKTIFVSGIGDPKNANILFLSSCPLEEDIDDKFSSPSLLKSGPGALLRRICMQNGINLDNEYFTSLVKYALPRKFKLKPSAKDIAYCKPLLDEELEYVKPSIIVCLGKEPMSYILGINIGVAKLEEGWIYSHKYNALVYIMTDPVKAFFKPEYFDKLSAEMVILSRLYDALANGKMSIAEVPTNYQLIDSFDKLDKWLIEREQNAERVFAVDCEWRGLNYYDGNLRSIQFAWAPGQAVFIHLFDENNKWVFDVTYDQVKERLQRFFNRPDIKYYGHNFCADAVWMKNHLGLDIWGRCLLDTQYAFQTANEYEDLGLKKLAAKYTDMGKYDIPLILYMLSKRGKKNEPQQDIEDSDNLIEGDKAEGKDDDGYGDIPLDILYPYGVRDADATFRLAGIAFQWLLEDGTLKYYYDIKNPYVTDGFAALMETGIPFNTTVANKVRLAYLYCLSTMELIFKAALRQEAEDMFITNATELTLNNDEKVNKLLEVLHDRNISFDAGVGKIKRVFGHKNFMKLVPYYRHYYFLDTFNVASADQKRVWLFELKKYQPIKSTKTDTGNAIDWERVLLLPESERKTYTPAVDKDTLKVYSGKGDDLCQILLEINAVATILKTFLKGKDGGLQKFLSSDGRLRPNYSLTESNRPKSFKPNILNIPRYVTDFIKNAFKRTYAYIGCIINKDPVTKETTLDFSKVDDAAFNEKINQFKQVYNIEETITKEELKSEEIRNCFTAPEGWYFASADLKTAEIFAIAYLAGDENLINMLTGPDLQFAYKRMPDGKEKVVRIAYVDDIVKFSDAAKDPSLLTDINDPDLVRDSNGELKHPARDLHWESVETIYFLDTPREKLDKEKTRNACGKRVNFCSGKDNLIYHTEKGYIPAKDVRVGDVLYSRLGRTVVYSRQAIKHQDCIKFIFSTGIEATYHIRHKLLCQNHDGSIDWKEAKDLKSDDNILTYHLPLSDKETIPEIREFGQYKIDINSDAFAQLLGMFSINGDIKDGHIEQYVPNDKAKEELNLLLQQVGNMKIHVSTYVHGGDGYFVYYGNLELARYVKRHLKFKNRRFQEYSLPNCIFTKWTKSQIKAFIKGVEYAAIANGHNIKEDEGFYVVCDAFSDWLSQFALLCNYAGYQTQLIRHSNEGASPLVNTLNVFTKKDVGKFQYTTQILHSYKIEDTIIALGCDHHEYIDMSMASHNSAPYGASEDLIERGIEVETKEKPAPGTGRKLLDAYYKTKPGVTKFLTEREDEVLNTGYYLSPTGFKRHYKVPPEDGELPKFLRRKLIKSLQRQNRNIGLQSLVADTLAIAIVKISYLFRQLHMRAYVVCGLYDALYVVCPKDELLFVHKLIKKCFSDDIGWKLKGGTLHFQTDHETGVSWGSHVDKYKEKQLLLESLDIWKDNPEIVKFDFLEDVELKALED